MSLQVDHEMEYDGDAQQTTEGNPSRNVYWPALRRTAAEFEEALNARRGTGLAAGSELAAEALGARGGGVLAARRGASVHSCARALQCKGVRRRARRRPRSVLRALRAGVYWWAPRWRRRERKRAVAEVRSVRRGVGLRVW